MKTARTMLLLVLSLGPTIQTKGDETDYLDIQTRINGIVELSFSTNAILSNDLPLPDTKRIKDAFESHLTRWEQHYEESSWDAYSLIAIYESRDFWILINAGPRVFPLLSPYVAQGRHSAAGLLWLTATRTRAVEDENPWFDEPLDYLWKAGTACADKRVLFLLSEWRTAIRENRAEDANHAKLALIAQGIFAYHALFREIELGREDAWIILENTDMPYPGMRRMNREEWMVWWREHQSEYTFKLQDPKTDQSPHLEKWRRLGK